ncbi:hypothetical protein LTLLF_145740 [Microtus ochrogaster]|uniref:Uncharacterized protein n=1 Tax=Microtus ochrogaster TaxID=79684 RepID=A0A8J6GF72_MICOH|nr:hypothetical protein LTLLF_145740 [Microtus ochrogaster]
MSVPRDISDLFTGHSIVENPGIPSDITCVVATSTALEEFLQGLYSSPKNMLARPWSLLGGENGEGRETTEGLKKVGLQPQCKMPRKKWSRRASREPPSIPSLLTKKQALPQAKSSYEKLKMEHRQIIPDMQILKSENIEALQKFSELTKELGFYCD